MATHKSRNDDQTRRWNWVLILAGVGFLAAFLYIGASIPTPAAIAAANVQPAATVKTGQDVRLATALFNDGHARFYSYTSGTGREIRFLVIRPPDNVVRVAFDACDACFRSRRGFRQAGDKMVCNNCGGGLPSIDINVSAARCLPRTLDHSIDGDQLVITAAAIERGVSYF